MELSQHFKLWNFGEAPKNTRFSLPTSGRRLRVVPDKRHPVDIFRPHGWDGPDCLTTAVVSRRSFFHREGTRREFEQTICFVRKPKAGTNLFPVLIILDAKGKVSAVVPIPEENTFLPINGTSVFWGDVPSKLKCHTQQQVGGLSLFETSTIQRLVEEERFSARQMAPDPFFPKIATSRRQRCRQLY